MSSFTPRAWKSQPERAADAPAGKFQAYHVVKPNNLPIARTAFIGREHDVADVKELLNSHAVVTLVGSGGVGKTRLALQVASELLDRYPDGVWFVDLAPISDPELVSSVTAQAVGMSQQAGRRIDEAIPHWLQRKKLLLLLDNCEHVLEPVASLAAAILRTAPDVRILATSRQVLDIGGEEVARVPSLDAPAAVALFVARATSANRSFTLTDDEAPIVAEICRRLDGIPLAIELSAARVNVLSVSHLAERLNERFKILTGGSRDALPRQKTLSALIDWSYDLLTPQEQRLFARLGIFAGGFGLGAATNVCGGEDLEEIDILDLLGSLTDKSLVVADTRSEHERYRLLESTAAYALEKLGASGQREARSRRHAEYFRDQAKDADERFGTVSMVTWLAAVELELDNYRAALAWALTQGNDYVLGGATAGALGEMWSRSGLAVEARYWIGLALERLSETEHPQIAARLRFALSWFSTGKRKGEAAGQAMRLYASVGDTRWTARAQSQLAYALFQMGRHDEAKAEIEQARLASRECDDRLNEANCLNVQASIESNRGDVRAARDLYGQALTTYKAFGNELGAALVLSNLGEMEFADGNPEQALRFVSESLEHLRGRHAANIAIGHNNGAAYRIALNEVSDARESAREALRIARHARSEQSIPISLQHLALLAALGGEEGRAAQLLGYVNAQYQQLGMKREPTEQWGYDKLVVRLRDTLSEDEIAQLAAAGVAWSEDQAVEEALKVHSVPVTATLVTDQRKPKS
jgi:predicted ATPase